MKKSVLTKDQSKRFGPFENGSEKVFINVRHDDHCGNGHNTFSITCDIYENGRDIGGGCMHDLVVKFMPELAGAVKFHLCSTDGPLHYLANTLYHVEQGNLVAARNSAIWPDAELSDLTKENLEKRLPKVMTLFYHVVTLLDLEY